MTSHGNVWSVLLSVVTAAIADSKSLNVSLSATPWVTRGLTRFTVGTTAGTADCASLFTVLSRIRYLCIVGTPVLITWCGRDPAQVGCRCDFTSCAEVSSMYMLPL